MLIMCFHLNCLSQPHFYNYRLRFTDEETKAQIKWVTQDHIANEC